MLILSISKAWDPFFGFFSSTITISSLIAHYETVMWILDATNIILENCMFEDRGIYCDGITNVMLKNCTFHNLIIEIEDTKEVVIEDCLLYNSPTVASNSTVTLKGKSEFIASNQAIASFSSKFYLSGEISFINNTGTRGAAMILYSSTLNIAPNTNVTFINNSAKDRGGAVYVESGVAKIFDQVFFKCFYQLLNCSENTNYSFYFSNNSAPNGGNDIYRAFLHDIYCLPSDKCNLIVNVTSPSNSSISSDPLHVCKCDSSGKPQCSNSSDEYINDHLQVYPGETFVLLAVVVGGDMGLTTGAVYADFSPKNWISTKQPISQNIQLITGISSCGQLTYTLYPHEGVPYVLMYLNTAYRDSGMLAATSCDRKHCGLTTPVLFNITILHCPPGFIYTKETLECTCNPVLTHLGVECHLFNREVAFSWTGEVWIKVSEDVIIYNNKCPLHYCDKNNKQINLQNESAVLCSFNRAGRLCGGCKENYSLAIGSSHCIHCPNNNNLALLIFFTAAGFLLVFFISAFNLTVTQGMINGLIFYANIVWTYQDIFFPREQKINTVLRFLKVFVAWINLDFGIESCFVNGLTAFWKTWLQFIFPLYVWSIAGLVIVTARYSTRLTNLLGNRAVPVLATLFLLSYMKLLRIVVSALEFSVLNYDRYETGSTLVVWSIDGSLTYFGYPHILLFLAGLATLMFLWLPCTLLLFFMQWLRKISHFRFLKWTMRFHPVYDAYFAPLKHKHQYWFGLLLLTRGILLVTFASTFAVPRSTNLLLLLVLGTVLLLYMAIVCPYKSKVAFILQSSFLSNLVLLSGFVFFSYTQSAYQPTLQAYAIGLSVGIAFVKLCGIIVYAMIVTIHSKIKQVGCCNNDNREELSSDFTDNRRHDPDIDIADIRPLLTERSKCTY